MRVVQEDGTQIGVLSKGDAIALAKKHGVDLVEIASSAKPPVCQLVDYGRYRYLLSKKQKEKKKTQTGNKLKEIQLSPVIDGHDFKYKLQHAIEFLEEDMKVKVSLRFKGRQMAHRDVGMEIMKQFLRDLKGSGNADAEPKMVGRSINVVVSPLAKSKRVRPPGEKEPSQKPEGGESDMNGSSKKEPEESGGPAKSETESQEPKTEFGKDAFSNLELGGSESESPESSESEK